MKIFDRVSSFQLMILAIILCVISWDNLFTTRNVYISVGVLALDIPIFIECLKRLRI